VNTSIVGAFAADSGLVRLDSVCEAIRSEVPTQTEENVAAAVAAAHAVRRAVESGAARV